MLELDKDERKARISYHNNWFKTAFVEIPFEEITAVIHKSQEPRIGYTSRILSIYNTRKKKIKKSSKNIYIEAAISTVILLLTSIMASPEFMGIPLFSLTELKDGYDYRPTALSLVKGRNLQSLIMLPSYGWSPLQVELTVEKCKEYNIKVFDKRPHLEKKDQVFL